MDNIEQMQDREILMELLEEKRERDNQKRIATILIWIAIAVVFIALAVCIPKVIDMYRRYNQAMQYIDTLYGQVEEVLATYTGMFEKLNKLDVDGVVKTLNDVSALFNGLFGG